jgi:hypothetical protein
MANRNTIADVINRQNNGQPLVITSTTTLHQSFNLANGSQAVLSIPSTMAPIDGPAPFPNLTAQGRPFVIKFAGTVLGGEKIQVDLVQGLGLVNVVSSTGLYTNGLTADNFLIEFTGLWDAQSTLLRGFYEGFVGNISVGNLAIPGIIQPANLAALQFNLALTINTSNVNASVAITEFSADLL